MNVTETTLDSKIIKIIVRATKDGDDLPYTVKRTLLWQYSNKHTL